MGQFLTPKQRTKSALEIVQYMVRRERRNARDDLKQKTLSDSRPSEAARKTQQILDRATKAVFEKSGLNINDNEDWKFLLPWLAWAMYGKNAGRPRRWTKKQLRALLIDVRRLQAENHNLAEEACCEELLKDIRYLDTGVTKAATLRRRLQQAKGLDLKRKK